MSQVTLKVGGMKCGGCVGAIKAALLHLEGVADVSVSLERGEVQADIQEGKVSESQFKMAIRDKGYSVD